MKHRGLFLLSAFLTSAIGCLLLAIAVAALTPDEWLVLAGLLPAAAAADTTAPPPVAIQLSPLVLQPPALAETPSSGEPPADRPVPTPLPAPVVSQVQVNFVADLMQPLIEEAHRRRAAREKEDPQGYARRIDKQLNQNRINFLVYGYGTTYEPPFPPGYKGSIAVYSLDLRTLQIASVTLNHDIRAPEVERYLLSQGRRVPPTRIDQVYLNGGFDLLRTTVEDATSLSMDFQLAFQDSVVKNVVDEVFGGLVVDVPYVFEAAPIYFENNQYPALHYAQGRQKLNGLQALQFIKAINAQLGKTKYDPTKELAVRKQIITQSVLEAVKRETANPFFWAKMLSFLRRTLDKKDIAYDFDAADLLFKTISQYVAGGARGQKMPISVTRSVYVVDWKVGDGGVQWVTGSINPIMQRDLKNGVYVDIAMSVPIGKADPYASDLAAGYWTSVRQLVRQRLGP
jgi:LytR_cpsA_psr family